MQSPTSLAPITKGRNLSATAEKLSEIRERLKPAPRERVGEILGWILAQYPNVRDSGPEGIAARAAGYVVALEGFGEAALMSLHAAILRGSQFDPRFLPLAPEMAAYCRNFEKLDRQIVHWNERAVSQLEDRERIAAHHASKTPEEKARVLALAEETKRRLKVSTDLASVADAAGSNPELPQEET